MRWDGDVGLGFGKTVGHLGSGNWIDISWIISRTFKSVLWRLEEGFVIFGAVLDQAPEKSCSRSPPLDCRSQPSSQLPLVFSLSPNPHLLNS